MRTLIPMLSIAALAASVAAGDLDPPGPPFPTPGPEPRTAINMENTPGDSDSRFRITSPGSYYLTGNITLGMALNGIEIGADNVTLDLNGFALQRNAIIGFPPLSGIVADSGVENVTVRNGVVRDFSQIGVDLSNARNTLVDQIIVSGNGDDGMWIGANGVVTRCVAEDNGGDGIQTISSCSVVDCTVAENTGMGIRAGSYSTVRGCTVFNNTGSGIYVSGGRCLVIENSCTHNGDGDDAGILIFDFATARANRIEGNNVAFNNMGINVNHSGNLIIRNSASQNGTDYSIVGGNTAGPIISGPGTIASTNPWANFSF